jgi:NTE family protein
MSDPATEAQVAQLTERGAQVELITPDEQSTEVMMTDLLAPSVRTPAANAGLAQATTVLAAVTRWLA